MECVDHAHCSTPHVIALALPALTAPLAHTLASFPGPNQLFIACSVQWSCGVKMSSAHCLAPHVAVLLALQALHAHPSIFKFEILSHPSSSWQIELKWPARNSHAKHSTHMKPGCTIARALTLTGNCISECDILKCDSNIYNYIYTNASLTLRHSAMTINCIIEVVLKCT